MTKDSAYPHRRAFTRVQFPITALVTINGATAWAPVRDMSLAGLSIRIDAPIAEGTPCTVELRREDALDEPWITANGIVVRVIGDLAGIQFQDIVGVDSLNHLRSLLMYHADDPDDLLAEFSAHWGILPSPLKP